LGKNLGFGLDLVGLMNVLQTSLTVQYASMNGKQLSYTHPLVHSKVTNNAMN